ncbi:MAG: TraB/GumN family protein [Kordiimonadaceae bacterium]|nr:TraB/GumN family protein [Kordiimonadaceae bacterium]
MNFSLSIKRILATAITPVFILTAAFSLPAHAEEAPQPALWKLSDSDSEIYLFGTVHILKPDTKWRSDKVMAAFNNSQIVYFEAPTEDTPPAKMQALMAPYMTNPAGVTLSSRVSPESYAKMVALAPTVGIPAAALPNFEPLRPWLVTLTFTVQQMIASGYAPDSGVEKILYGLAKKADKDLAYLETIEFQLGLFGSLAPEVENQMFEDGMDQLSEGSAILDSLVSDWSKGNVEGVANTMNAGFEDAPELQELMLVSRNRNWAEQIDTMMKGSGKIFIAVGSGHLAGEESVQDLLEAKGYKVVRQ